MAQGGGQGIEVIEVELRKGGIELLPNVLRPTVRSIQGESFHV